MTTRKQVLNEIEQVAGELSLAKQKEQVKKVFSEMRKKASQSKKLTNETLQKMLTKLKETKKKLQRGSGGVEDYEIKAWYRGVVEYVLKYNISIKDDGELDDLQLLTSQLPASDRQMLNRDVAERGLATFTKQDNQCLLYLASIAYQNLNNQYHLGLMHRHDFLNKICPPAYDSCGMVQCTFKEIQKYIMN